MFGSNEWHDDDYYSTGERALAIGVMGVFGLGCVPVTLALGLWWWWWW